MKQQIHALLPYLIILFISLLLFFCYSIYKLHQYKQEKMLFHLVAWCANTNLCYYIREEQADKCFPAEYCILGDTEWQFVKEILTEYQRDLTKSFFDCSLSLQVIKCKHDIPGDRGEHYFMLSLCSFLGKHQCAFKFCEHDMQGETLEYKRYGDGPFPPYDATYSLTDFSSVYHKLYYIVYSFCQASKFCNPNGEFYRHPESIKKILDTKQIKISSIRI